MVSPPTSVSAGSYVLFADTNNLGFVNFPAGSVERLMVMDEMEEAAPPALSNCIPK